MALAPPTTDGDAAGPGESRTCLRCGSPVEAFTLELQMGLGPRTFTSECPCEQEPAPPTLGCAAPELGPRPRCFRQSGIGRRHEASRENFTTSSANRNVVVPRLSPRSPGRGPTLGLAGTGRHTRRAVTRADRPRVSAVIVNAMLLLTFRDVHGNAPSADRCSISGRCEHCADDRRAADGAGDLPVVNARYQECS
jgi:hypothetical protein